jgi:hypothetical protein
VGRGGEVGEESDGEGCGREEVKPWRMGSSGGYLRKGGVYVEEK